MGDEDFLTQMKIWYRLALLTGGITAISGSGTGSGGVGGNVDQGNLQVPTASANGTELPNRPSITSGVIFTLAAGASITFYLDNTGITHGAPLADTKGFAPASGSGEYSVRLSASKSIYVTAITGSVLFNWVYQP